MCSESSKKKCKQNSQYGIFIRHLVENNRFSFIFLTLQQQSTVVLIVL